MSFLAILDKKTGMKNLLLHYFFVKAIKKYDLLVEL